MSFLLFVLWRYRDTVSNIVEENSGVFSSPNALVAVGKGMQTVKLCFNKILQFLTAYVGLHRLT